MDPKVARFQVGFGSLAPGEAVFDRYGMPIGFLRSWHIDEPEVMYFSKDPYGERYSLDPIITLELGQTCPQGREVKINMDHMDLDLYEPDNMRDIPISQFGRYAFGLDKLADALTKAVDLEALSSDEAIKEFRQFVLSVQKDEDKAKLIAKLQERLAELEAE